MPTIPTDPCLPGAAELLGDDARAALAPAVEAAGGHLDDVTPTQVRYEPARRMLVRYRAAITWPGAGQRTETLGAVASQERLPGGLAVVQDDGGARVGVWRYPHDPYLPGLPHAGYPHGVREVLAGLGLDAAGAVVEPIVYRPGTRAVLRVRTLRHELYLKVLRPGLVEPIRRAHDAFGGRIRVPRCVAWSDELGLLVLEALPGDPLTRTLAGGGPVPHAATVLGLLDDIAGVPVEVPPPGDVVGGYTGLLRQVLPDQAGLIDELACAASAPAHPDRTVHGDFHGKQLLHHGDRVSGVLDIDGARRGSHAEDIAALVGHLMAMAYIRPETAHGVVGYTRQVLACARERVAWPSLHSAVTAHLLGLATTWFRRQDVDWPARTAVWIALVGSWAEEGERALTALSSALHGRGTGSASQARAKERTP
jgi:hypothetical protein